MGKPGGSGGTSTLFTTHVFGPPPGTDTTPADQWIDMGLIPTDSKVWFGSASYTSTDKSITFELRTNLANESTGTVANTSLLAATSVSVRAGTVNADYYKAGRLHIVNVLGTGLEKWWLRLKSKVATAGSYLYIINYTTE